MKPAEKDKSRLCLGSRCVHWIASLDCEGDFCGGSLHDNGGHWCGNYEGREIDDQYEYEENEFDI